MDNQHRNTMVYIGTYTGKESRGIYAYRFNCSTGDLSLLQTYSDLVNPSYLTAAENHEYLYAIGETDTFQGIPGGTVASYKINGQTGELSFINNQSTKGKGPCYISTDLSNQFLFTANYGDGTFTIFPIAPDGSIQPDLSVTHHHGSGPNKERQEQPHVHFASLTPDERLLCVVDLGIDKVMLYQFNKENGGIWPWRTPFIPIKPGSGPRHMTFHPNGQFVYLINELTSDIMVFEYLPARFTFREIQHITTLPEGYAGINYCAAIHIAPGGNYLYASNRGHDSIAVFAINPDSGRLALVSHSSTEGNFPRDFAISPDGRFLLAANQNSNTVNLFSIHQNTGELIYTGNAIHVPNPTCVQFVSI